MQSRTFLASFSKVTEVITWLTILARITVAFSTIFVRTKYTSSSYRQIVVIWALCTVSQEIIGYTILHIVLWSEEYQRYDGYESEEGIISHDIIIVDDSEILI